MTLRPFGLDGKPTHPKVVQETSSDSTASILKAHFANMADAQAFWLGREAHMRKSGIRNNQRLDSEDSKDPLYKHG